MARKTASTEDKQAAEAEEAKVETVTVKCAVDSLYEGGERYKKGDDIEVTPARAEALGKNVTR